MAKTLRNNSYLCREEILYSFVEVVCSNLLSNLNNLKKNEQEI